MHLEYVRSVRRSGQYPGINSCCMLPDSEMLLANDSHLLRINSYRNVVGKCVCMRASGACYIGDNTAVVCPNTDLVYVDVGSMSAKRKVKINHTCKSIACHNHTLYVVSESTLHTYTLDGTKRSVIYINGLKNSDPDDSSGLPEKLNGIAVSNDGSRLYITTNQYSLITIDSSGNHLNTLWFDDLLHNVFVDERGNVWVCVGFYELYQISADGSRLLNKIKIENKKTLYGFIAMCYDRDRSYLIVIESERIKVFKLN